MIGAAGRRHGVQPAGHSGAEPEHSVAYADAKLVDVHPSSARAETFGTEVPQSPELSTAEVVTVNVGDVVELVTQARGRRGSRVCTTASLPG